MCRWIFIACVPIRVCYRIIVVTERRISESSLRVSSFRRLNHDTSFTRVFLPRKIALPLSFVNPARYSSFIHLFIYFCPSVSQYSVEYSLECIRLCTDKRMCGTYNKCIAVHMRAQPGRMQCTRAQRCIARLQKHCAGRSSSRRIISVYLILAMIWIV